MPQVDSSYDLGHQRKFLIITDEKCPNVEISLAHIFSRILVEYGDLLSQPLYLVQMRESVGQKYSTYGYFSCLKI